MAKLPVKQIFKFGFGVLDDLGMFSPTEKVLDTMQQTKGTPDQMFTQMKKIGGKGVQEEMMFTGIEDAFATSPKVTSQELKNYLADNKTRVNEVVKNEMKALEAGQVDIFQEFKNMNFELNDTMNQKPRLFSFNDLADQVTQGNTSIVDDYMKKYNPDMLGYMEEPNISVLKFDDMSQLYKDKINVSNKPKIKELEEDGMIDAEDYVKSEYENENFINIEFRDDTYDQPNANIDQVFGIQGNDTYGYEIIVDGQVNIELGTQPSLNEAILQLNQLRREIYDEQFVGKKNVHDLLPKHEQYTLPGGDNYNEILLTMPEPPDIVETVISDWKDAFTSDVSGVYNIRLPFITGSPSDVTIGDEAFLTLKQGDPITIDTNLGPRQIRINKDNQLELLKKDYKNFAHTGDEKNVIVFARTKDRVDRDGKKILYVEELQSDMAQQGRKKGFIMGVNEKRAFINKNNPVIFGDILDEIQKLKDTTNIDTLTAVKGSRIEFNKMPIGDTYVEFKSDFNDVFEVALTDFGFEREEQIAKLFQKAKPIEEIIKQKMTKYKFLPVKEKSVQRLSNAGIDKNNASLIDNYTLEERNMVIPDNLYTDISDYVDTSYITRKIGKIKRKVFNDYYAREYNKWLKNFADRNASPSKLDESQFNKNVIRNILPKEKLDELDRDIKNEVSEFYHNQDISGYTEIADEIGIPQNLRGLHFSKLKDEDDLYLANNAMDRIKGHYLATRGKELELKKVPRKKDDFGATHKEVISKKQFIELQTEMAETRFYENLVYEAKLKNPKLLKEVESFDYDITKTDDVLRNLYNLEAKLEKADAFEVKLNPIASIPSGPFIGSSERFTELGIKRLMKHAVDNDYDGISFSSGKIHDKRWGQPNLTQYYDVVIPKVAKNILKGTDATLENKTIFSDKLFLDRYNDNKLDYENHVPEDYDFIDVLDEDMTIKTNGGFIKNSPTIYLTPNVKEYVNSGISLYTPIVATGLTGAVTSQILGSEEDIVKDEVL